MKKAKLILLETPEIEIDGVKINKQIDYNSIDFGIVDAKALTKEFCNKHSWISPSSYLIGFSASQQLNEKKYSKEDMESFAHYLKNGLNNLEYCEKEHNEHLIDWEKDYRRTKTFEIEIEETETTIKILKKL